MNMIRFVLLAFLLGGMTSCENNLDETPESSFVWNELNPPHYSFKRNGISSVDYKECEYLSSPIQTMYESYLRQARLMNQSQYELLCGYYEEGLYGIAPKDEVAQSPLCNVYRPAVLADLDELIDETRRISGGYSPDPSAVRNREAVEGETGFIGSNITDPNLIFVNAKGVVVSEVWRNYIYGAIYLDKILNVHLDEGILTNQEVRDAHQNVVLPPGRNYTMLEHHWDLAYGYYKNFWQKFAQADGLLVMKDSHRTIFEAFAYGRLAMKTFDYKRMMEYRQVIVNELSRVVAIRAMYSLLGPNTLANLNEDPRYAFSFVSQALGFVYALQFASRADGQLSYSREDLLRLMNSMTEGRGLWNVDRMRAGAEHEGSLLYVANEIGKPFGITAEQIKR